MVKGDMIMTITKIERTSLKGCLKWYVVYYEEDKGLLKNRMMINADNAEKIESLKIIDYINSAPTHRKVRSNGYTVDIYR